MLQAGADKVSLNSAAVARPEVIREASEWFGAQAIVLSMDVKWNGEFYEIVTHGGRRPTGLDAVEWAQRGVELGAGEIVVNSIDADGTKNGFEITLTRMISDAVTVPVVASGGAGNADHMADVLLEGQRRRGAGRQHLPLRHAPHRRGQGAPDRARPADAADPAAGRRGGGVTDASAELAPPRPSTATS